MSAKGEFIELIVRTSDGGFESTLKVPVESTKGQREGFAKVWIDSIASVIKMSPKEE